MKLNDNLSKLIAVCSKVGVAVPVVLFTFTGESVASAEGKAPVDNANDAPSAVSRNEVMSRILASIRLGLTRPSDIVELSHVDTPHTNVITSPHVDIPHTNNPSNYCDPNTGRCEHMNIPHQDTPIQHDDTQHVNRDD